MSHAATITTDRPALRPARTALLRFELLRVLRNRRSLVFMLLFPIAMFLAVTAMLPERGRMLAGGQANVAALIMVNMAVYGAVSAATSAGASVAVERAQGWTRTLRLTPLRSSSYIVTKMVAALVTSAIAVVSTFATGYLSGMVTAPARSWALAFVAVVVGSLMFAAFGLLIGYLLPGDSAMQYLGGLLAILAMLGGIFTPIPEGSTFDHIAAFTPIYGLGKLASWTLTLRPHGSFGAAFHPMWLVNLAVWTIVCVAGASWRFSRDTDRV